jgi:hypothetical protein
MIIDNNTPLSYLRPMKTLIIKGLALGLFIALTSSSLQAQTASPTDQTAAQPAQSATGEDIGYGFGSVLANMFYIPAKVTYAGLGLLTGGVGYLITGGRADVANNIIYPAVGGNYVVTPNQLKGSEPLYFVGAPPAPPAESPQAAQTPAPAADSTVTR